MADEDSYFKGKRLKNGWRNSGRGPKFGLHLVLAQLKKAGQADYTTTWQNYLRGTAQGWSKERTDGSFFAGSVGWSEEVFGNVSHGWS